MKWKNSNYISSSKYKLLYCNDGILPRAYGFPKIHKSDYLFRLIISSIDNSLYSLAFFLHKLIIDNISNTFSHVDNSFHLIGKFKMLTLTTTMF